MEVKRGCQMKPHIVYNHIISLQNYEDDDVQMCVLPEEWMDTAVLKIGFLSYKFLLYRHVKQIHNALISVYQMLKISTTHTLFTKLKIGKLLSNSTISLLVLSKLAC